MLASALTSSSLVSNVFVALAALLAVVGGIIGALNYRGKSAVRSARQDEAADIVFGKGDEPNIRQLVVAQGVKLDVVYGNMLQNGGKSLRDDMTQIRTDQAAMNNTLQQLVGKVDLLNGQAG